MKNLIAGLVVISPLLIFIGCGPVKEVTTIKPGIIKPAVIEDTLSAELHNSSEVEEYFTAAEIVNKDTVKYIEFRPDSLLLTKIKELKKENSLLGAELKNIGKFYIKIKPDSIIVWDTLKTTQIVEKKIETPLLSKAGLILIGIILGIAGLYYIRR